MDLAISIFEEFGKGCDESLSRDELCLLARVASQSKLREPDEVLTAITQLPQSEVSLHDFAQMIQVSPWFDVMQTVPSPVPPSPKLQPKRQVGAQNDPKQVLPAKAILQASKQLFLQASDGATSYAAILRNNHPQLQARNHYTVQTSFASEKQPQLRLRFLAAQPPAANKLPAAALAQYQADAEATVAAISADAIKLPEFLCLVVKHPWHLLLPTAVQPLVHQLTGSQPRSPPVRAAAMSAARSPPVRVSKVEVWSSPSPPAAAGCVSSPPILAIKEGPQPAVQQQGGAGGQRGVGSYKQLNKQTEGIVREEVQHSTKAGLLSTQDPAHYSAMQRPTESKYSHSYVPSKQLSACSLPSIPAMSPFPSRPAPPADHPNTYPINERSHTAADAQPSQELLADEIEMDFLSSLCVAPQFASLSAPPSPQPQICEHTAEAEALWNSIAACRWLDAPLAASVLKQRVLSASSNHCRKSKAEPVAVRSPLRQLPQSPEQSCGASPSRKGRGRRSAHELPHSPAESYRDAIEGFLQGSQQLQQRLMASAGLQAKGAARSKKAMVSSEARRAAVADAGGIEGLVSLVGHGDAAGQAAAAVALGNLMTSDSIDRSLKDRNAAIEEFVQRNYSLQQQLAEAQPSSGAIESFLKKSQNLQRTLTSSAGLCTKAVSRRIAHELPHSPAESYRDAIEGFLQGSQQLQQRLMASAGLQAKGAAAARSKKARSPGPGHNAALESLLYQENVVYSRAKQGKSTHSRGRPQVPLQDLLPLGYRESCSSPISKLLHQSYSPSEAHELLASRVATGSASTINEFVQSDSEKLPWEFPHKNGTRNSNTASAAVETVGGSLFGKQQPNAKCSASCLHDAKTTQALQLPPSPTESCTINSFLQGGSRLQSGATNGATMPRGHAAVTMPRGHAAIVPSKLPQSPTVSSHLAIEQFLAANQCSQQPDKRSALLSYRLPSPEFTQSLNQSPTASCNIAIEQFLKGEKVIKQRLHHRLHHPKSCGQHSGSTLNVSPKHVAQGVQLQTRGVRAEGSHTDTATEDCASVNFSFSSSCDTAEIVEPRNSIESPQQVSTASSHMPIEDFERSTSPEDCGPTLEVLAAELFVEMDIDSTGKINLDELAMLLLKFARSYRRGSVKFEPTGREHVLFTARSMIASFGTMTAEGSPESSANGLIDMGGTLDALSGLFHKTDDELSQSQLSITNSELPDLEELRQDNLTVVSPRKSKLVIEFAQQFFDAVDVDGCGYINHDELECLLLKLGRAAGQRFSRNEITEQATEAIERFGDEWITPGLFYFSDFLQLLFVDPWNRLLPENVRFGLEASPLRASVKFEF